MSIPLNMKEIYINNCDKVVISQTQLAALKMKTLVFSRVDLLRIVPGTLKTVDKLVVEHVETFEYTDGFKHLDADEVTFSHVNFPVGAKFHPISIRKLLQVNKSNLIGVSMNVISPSTERIVSIDNSVLDRVSFKIKAAIFVMMENRIAQLPPLAAGLMDVAYSHGLSLRNNQFGMVPVKAILLPHVWSSDQSFVFESKDKVLPVESQRWLGHFNFAFTGTVMHLSKVSRTECEHHRRIDMYITSCPNFSTYLRSLSSWVRNSTTTTQKPHNERLLQGKSDASAVKQNLELSLISIFLILMLRFYTNRL